MTELHLRFAPLALALLTAACGTAPVAPPAAPKPQLPPGQWSGVVHLGHPLAAAAGESMGQMEMVIQNCGPGLTTFTKLRNGEHVRDRSYVVLPHGDTTMLYSLAKSKVSATGWHEVRVLTLNLIDDQRLHTTLTRSTTNPTAPLASGGRVQEVFGVGRLDFSPTCTDLLMAQRQLTD